MKETNLSKYLLSSIKRYYQIIPPNFRPGPYRKTTSFLEKTKLGSLKDHQLYQITSMKRLINHAYNNVSYYRKLFDKEKLKPNDFKSLDDLPRIPFLTKEIIKKKLPRFKS